VNVLTVYASALLLGLAILLFPAASGLLTGELFGLSTAQYGLMFTPQIAATILSSAVAGRMGARFGERRLLAVGLSALVGSMVVFAAVPRLAPGAAYPAVLLATSFLGAAFGLSITALNALAFALFSARADAALSALHMAIGLGMVGSAPLLQAALWAGHWWLGPAAVSLLALTLAVIAGVQEPDRSEAGIPAPAPVAFGPLPRRVDLYAFAVLLYGAVEAILGVWTALYLREDLGLTAADGALGLSLFWAAITGGRFLFSVLDRWLPARWAWLQAPAAMAVSLAMLPSAQGRGSLVVVALVGLAMSIYFPVAVSLASAEEPQRLAAVSGRLVAGIGVGVGLSTVTVGWLRPSLGLPTILRWSVLVVCLLWAVTAVLVRTRPSELAERR
jgi:fucose permease